jgi:subtilisin family serine protease
VAGVNWRVKIMALQIFTATQDPKDSNKSTIGTFDNVQIDAINYAVLNGAKILSNSYGTSLADPKAVGKPNPGVEAAIRRANERGVLFVASAGNDRNDNDHRQPFPASYELPNVISVAAIGPQETLADFGLNEDGRPGGSNFGRTRVHIAAPGGDSSAKSARDLILSTSPPSLSPKGEKYVFAQGTSMACPHVAGAAALVWGSLAYRSLSPEQLKNLLIERARRLPSLQGKCVAQGTLDISFLGQPTCPPICLFPPDCYPCPCICAPEPRCRLFGGLLFGGRRCR